jgi:DNA topoisomerase-1
MVQDTQTLCRRHGLTYVESSELGLRRRRCGKGFSYLDPSGRTLANTRTVARSSYMHSSIIEAYKEGKLKETLLRDRLRNGLTKIESALMGFLERDPT